MTARLLALACTAALAACAGGTWTTKTTGADGRTTVRGDAQSVARHEAQENEKEAYARALAAAPRRGPMDPIEVVVLEATLADSLKGIDAAQAQVLFVKELEGEPLFRVKVAKGAKDAFGRPPGTIEGQVAAAAERGVTGDVYVWPHLLLEDAVGLSGKGKLVAAKAFTLKTEIVSGYGTGAAAPSRRGSVFQNVQVLRDGAKECRKVILTTLGPGLPSRAAVADLQRERMSAQQKALVEKAAADPSSAEARFLKLLQGGKGGPEKQPASR
jgi:hypothetical protein